MFAANILGTTLRSGQNFANSGRRIQSGNCFAKSRPLEPRKVLRRSPKRIDADSIGVAIERQVDRGQQQDRHVEPQAPALDVFEVGSQAPFQVRAGRAVRRAGR